VLSSSSVIEKEYVGTHPSIDREVVVVDLAERHAWRSAIEARGVSE
jgi:hypothetical protein